MKKLNKKDYLRIYTNMLEIRRFEERAAQLFGMGHVGGFCHLYIGQEAVVVGVLMTINKNDSVLIIDDLIATGGTAEAAAKLVEKSGGKVAGFIFVINLFDLGGIKKLEDKGYKALSLIQFPGH